MTIPTLSSDDCRKRRKNLWEKLPESVGWVLIGDSRHIQYFCNFRVNPLSFSADQRALLLLQRDGGATLLADNFTRRAASGDPIVDEEIITPWYTHRKSVGNRDSALINALEECRDRWTNSAGLVEQEGVTAAAAATIGNHGQLHFSSLTTGHRCSVGDCIRALRRQKLPDEIAVLKHCMAAGDAGHAEAFNAIRPGVSELDVYLAIQRAAEQAAGCACSVYGDFRATNAEQFKAGGLPTNYILKKGDLFIADYSVIVHGYRSDFTNTIAVDVPTEAQTKQFEACRDALLAAEATLTPAASCSQVYEAASAVFLERGFPALGHHCGHGLGLEHPEPPILVPESTDILLEGDVVTIEPGLYIEGVGGMRFEHNYLVSETGYKRLSNHQIALTR